MKLTARLDRNIDRVLQEAAARIVARNSSRPTTSRTDGPRIDNPPIGRVDRVDDAAERPVAGIQATTGAP